MITKRGTWVLLVLVAFLGVSSIGNAIEITTTFLPSGMEMVPYSQQLHATNGVSPFTWDVGKAFSEHSEPHSFSATGTVWQIGMDQTFFLPLPFGFPFAGTTYTECYVDIHGNIYFTPRGTDFSPSEATLASTPMIAVLWRDYFPNNVTILTDIGSDTLTIRWHRGTDVAHSASLASDGTVTLRYGPGSLGDGMIGISAGDGQHSQLSVMSNSGDMSNSADIVFIPEGRLPEGLTLSPDGLLAGTPTQAGTSVVSVAVHDSINASTNGYLEISIAPNPNTRPEISSNAPPAGPFSMGEATNQMFTVWAHDPEGSNLTYYWTWDGVPVGGNQSSYIHTTDWGDAGQYTLRCTVSDGLWTGIVHSQWHVRVLFDNDEDGMSNAQERDLGRNPHDPSDAGNPSMLAGTVSGGGLALAGAYVELHGAGGTTYNRTLSQSDGTYTLYGVLPGHYYAKVGAPHFADQWYNAATHRTSAVPYAVPAATSIGGFDFDLAPGQSPALVEVNSFPTGAVVYLDLQPTPHLTPAIVDVGHFGESSAGGLIPASHTINVKLPGAPHIAPTTVWAREAETVQMYFDLVPINNALGSLSVSTTPEGAEVFIDYADVPVGISPITIANATEASSTRHLILVRQPGFLQPRPIKASAQEGVTNQISIPLTPAVGPNMSVEIQSVPPGAHVFVDYLPTTNLTDVVIQSLDPASHAGSGHMWYSASHTIMLRHPGFTPSAPLYVPESGMSTGMVNQTISVQDAIDGDKDGLPDQFEEAYDLPTLAPTENGPDDDPDNDGLSNREEMLAGTDPLDPNSTLGVDAEKPSEPGAPFVISFDSVPGRSYIVLATDSLVSGWTPASGIITATAHQTQWMAPASPGIGHSYFKVVTLGQ